MSDGLKDRHRAAIVASIAANDKLERAVLFGSRAMGTNTTTSDIDIALFGNRLTLTDQARLRAAIDKIPMAQSIDLVLHRSIDDPALLRHIRTHGVEWYRRRNTSEAKQHLDDEGSGTTIEMERVHNREWPTVQLGEVVDLLTGFPFKSDKYVSDPEAPRLLRGANIAQGNLRWDGTKRWPQEAIENLTPYWLRKGDVVIAMDRPWIEAGLKFSSVRETDLPALLVQRVARLRGRDRLDTRFLSYVIGCHDFTEHVLSVQTGTAVPHISAQQIKEFEFLLPHLPEQRAIARILGTLDDKIELNRRMNETLEAMARALFKSWFVDFDPVRAKMEGRHTGLPQEIAELFPDRLVNSEMGKIPEGWTVARLAELVDINPKRSLRRGQIAPYLPMASMPMRGHVPDSVDVRPFGSGIRFANGDTLVARITPCLENGKTAYVDFLPDNEVGWGSTEYIVLRPRPPLPNQFAYCLARSVGFREFAIQNMSGTSGRQRVPAAALAAFSMVAPPVRLAAQFGEAAGLFLDRASRAGRQSRTLAALRDTLLPRVMSGEIRLAEAEQAMEAEA